MVHCIWGDWESWAKPKGKMLANTELPKNNATKMTVKIEFFIHSHHPIREISGA
jgi:hypothetical protein